MSDRSGRFSRIVSTIVHAFSAVSLASRSAATVIGFLLIGCLCLMVAGCQTVGKTEMVPTPKCPRLVQHLNVIPVETSAEAMLYCGKKGKPFPDTGQAFQKKLEEVLVQSGLVSSFSVGDIDDAPGLNPGQLYLELRPGAGEYCQFPNGNAGLMPLIAMGSFGLLMLPAYYNLPVDDIYSYVACEVRLIDGESKAIIFREAVEVLVTDTCTANTDRDYLKKVREGLSERLVNNSAVKAIECIRDRLQKDAQLRARAMALSRRQVAP